MVGMELQVRHSFEKLNGKHEIRRPWLICYWKEDVVLEYENPSRCTDRELIRWQNTCSNKWTKNNAKGKFYHVKIEFVTLNKSFAYTVQYSTVSTWVFSAIQHAVLHTVEDCTAVCTVAQYCTVQYCSRPAFWILGISPFLMVWSEGRTGRVSLIIVQSATQNWSLLLFCQETAKGPWRTQVVLQAHISASWFNAMWSGTITIFG